MRFGRDIVELGGKDGEFVRGRHVEQKEREGGRASWLFLSVVFLLLCTKRKKNLHIDTGKKAPTKEQKCEHDNGFYNAKLPSSELQSTCALCILFFYPHHAVLSNSHS